MPHHYGMRAKTRHMFARDFRAHGPEHLSTYLTIYKVGDWVDVKANGTSFPISNVQKGLRRISFWLQR